MKNYLTADLSVGPAARPAPGPIEEVAVTLTSARELSVRLQALADRALGPTPETSGAAALPRVNSGGVLGDMREDARATQDLIADGMHALVRLEQVLA